MFTSTVTASLLKPFRLATYGMGLWRNRKLDQALLDAKLALGERMYAAGIDDGCLGREIESVTKNLQMAKAGGRPTHLLQATRQDLILRLATAALEDDGPLPGAEPEYQAARKAQAALLRYRDLATA